MGLSFLMYGNMNLIYSGYVKSMFDLRRADQSDFPLIFVFVFSCGFNQIQEDCSSVPGQARRARSSSICQLNMFFLPGTT